MRGNSHHKIITVVTDRNPFVSAQEINIMADWAHTLLPPLFNLPIELIPNITVQNTLLIVTFVFGLSYLLVSGLSPTLVLQLGLQAVFFIQAMCSNNPRHPLHRPRDQEPAPPPTLQENLITCGSAALISGAFGLALYRPQEALRVSINILKNTLTPLPLTQLLQKKAIHYFHPQTIRAFPFIFPIYEVGSAGIALLSTFFYNPCSTFDLTHLRELKLQYHPDKGGNQEDFIEFGKCLEYLKRK